MSKRRAGRFGRPDDPFPRKGMQCSDRWARILRKDGSKMWAALYCAPVEDGGGYYMELIFSSNTPSVVGPIADKIMEVFEKDLMVMGLGSWDEWNEEWERVGEEDRR